MEESFNATMIEIHDGIVVGGRHVAVTSTSRAGVVYDDLDGGWTYTCDGRTAAAGTGGGSIDSLGTE